MADASKAAIARRITERRMAMGLAQYELAAKMGIKQSNVSVAECEGLGSLLGIERWAEALGVNPVWLAYGTGKQIREGT